MGVLRAILAELLGLFVDDGALALALLLCCVAVGAAVALLPGLSAPLAGGMLLAGCAVILLLNVAGAARMRRRAR